MNIITDFAYINSMTNEELKKAPKLFCESILIGKSKEYFVVGMSSGAQTHIFSLTPQHAKRLLQYLSYEVNEYETTHGTIESEWKPLIKSPVQRNNPPTYES
jgi:hypothetical protein